MSIKFKVFFALSVFFILPTTILAVGFVDPVSVTTVSELFVRVGNIFWIILAGVALICFVIAGIMFLTAMGDPAKLKTARSAFIFGVVGIIIGILAFSIVTIVSSVLS